MRTTCWPLTRGGKAIRFPVDEVRVFQGRNSVGVRGVKLSENDALLSLGIVRHVEVTPAEARAYLKQVAALRRGEGEEEA